MIETTILTKPKLLLDVDGVINVDLPSWPGGTYTRANVTADGQRWPVRWSPDMLSRLVNLHLCELVDIVWCTTWCPYIEVLEELWGLPRFERAFTDPVTDKTRTRVKYAAALDVVNSGQRLIWIDDEDIPTAGPRRDKITAAGRTLLVVPAERYGLTPHHLDRITDFITRGHG